MYKSFPSWIVIHSIISVIISSTLKTTLAFPTRYSRSYPSLLRSMSVTASSTNMPENKPSVVVVGGGVIGSSILYYLTTKGYQPTLIERSSIAAAASGKSGGFLARNWDGGAAKELHQMSYDLHAQVAKDLDIGSYRKITTLSVQGGVRKRSSSSSSSQPSWLDRQARSELMDDDTAQVTPRELTEKLVASAKEKGAKVRFGTVIGMEFDEAEEGSGKRKVKAVKVEGAASIPCDYVVVAMGPWTPVAGQWFDCAWPMEGIYSTSIVIDGCEQAAVHEPYALFCGEDNNGCHLEVYPRPNGEIYICGLGGSDYVSGSRLFPGGDCDSPEKIRANTKRVAAAMKSLTGMTSIADGKEADIKTQACMRPCPPDALPIIGPVPATSNAFVAGGHNCWGILTSCGSGKIIADLIAEGKSPINLRPFSPDRFMRKSGGKRGRKMRDVDVGEQW